MRMNTSIVTVVAFLALLGGCGSVPMQEMVVIPEAVRDVSVDRGAKPGLRDFPGGDDRFEQIYRSIRTKRATGSTRGVQSTVTVSNSPAVRAVLNTNVVQSVVEHVHGGRRPVAVRDENKKPAAPSKLSLDSGDF